jgi:hypothetical protein
MLKYALCSSNLCIILADTQHRIKEETLFLFLFDHVHQLCEHPERFIC